MPECRHCGRVLPTCEVRRTALGYVCKERAPRELGARSRCRELASERAKTSTIAGVAPAGGTTTTRGAPSGVTSSAMQRPVGMSAPDSRTTATVCAASSARGVLGDLVPVTVQAATDSGSGGGRPSNRGVAA